ncbi:MAG: hypothetical protein LBH93_02890 [Chitinispirillales bacterium]|jgi:predicted nucleic acid-binding protein|nr:hypothetical protein [Chitinispirillales bacterium]
MKIYFDACCYGRPFDNQSEPGNAEDTVNLAEIVGACKIAGHLIVGSRVVAYEIDRNPKIVERAAIKELYDKTVDDDSVTASAEVAMRAEALQGEGIKLMDSYHLAAAEAAGADVLVAVDKGFLRVCRNKGLSVVRVTNPSTFLEEARRWPLQQ